MGFMGLMGGEETDVDALGLEVFLQFGDGDFPKVEHAGSQGCICLTDGEGITEMLLLTCTTTCDDRDLQVVCQLCQCLVGIARLHTIVIHTGKQDLPGTSFLSLVCPLKESAFHTLPSAFHIAMPAVRVEAGIDGANTYL